MTAHRRLALLLSLSVAFHLPGAAQAPSADRSRIDRLASLGRLWVAIREFHPWLGYRPIAWDSALAAAVPRPTAPPTPPPSPTCWRRWATR
jgi:hypothetical protein